MKSILYIKSSNIEDVRLAKFVKLFSKENVDVKFWGWERVKSNLFIPNNVKIEYILKGGGYGGIRLLPYYFLWIIKVFLKAIFTKKIDEYNVIAINFDSALPLYLVSKFKKFEYIYEIYDEFALSYKFPSWLVKIIKKIDAKIINKAKYVIHVDANRNTIANSKTIIIENTPYDFYEQKNIDSNLMKLCFAIIGNISEVRGMSHIYSFAKDNPNIHFILAGTFYNKEYEEKFLLLPNVTYYKRMPQNDLFDIIKKCCGIFSIYDPTLEINRLAASNKVYDAMMLGVPVITNPEVINSAFIKNNKIGFIIDYNYNTSWDILKEKEFLCKAKIYGANGRKLYEDKYIFDKMVKERLFPILA